MTKTVTHGPAMMARGDHFVEQWQGVPFRFDGRDQLGIDCWGLLLFWHEHVLGLELPDWRKGDHGRAWIAATIAEQARTHWHGLARPEDGCIIMAKVGASAGPGEQGPAIAPRHVGIYWRGNVLHATESHGVKYERLAEFAALYPRHDFGIYIR